MSTEHRCGRHGRPAVASRRVRDGGPGETEYLCELCLAEDRLSSGLGREYVALAASFATVGGGLGAGLQSRVAVREPAYASSVGEDAAPDGPT
jgi:hypothetical protein